MPINLLIETKNPAFNKKEMRILFEKCLPLMTRYTPLRLILDDQLREWNTQDARRVEFKLAYRFLSDKRVSNETFVYSNGLDRALEPKIREKLAKIPDTRIVE